MSVKNTFKNFFRLDDEEEYEEEEQEQPAPKKAKQKKQSGETQQAVQERPSTAMAIPNNRPRPNKSRNAGGVPTVVENEQVTPIHNVVSFTQKTSKVILFEPFSYTEAQDIGDCLKNKRAAVVNLQRIDKVQGKRIIDFLSGVIFALNGDIKQVGSNIFLCTPDNVEVDGTISNYQFDD